MLRFSVFGADMLRLIDDEQARRLRPRSRPSSPPKLYRPSFMSAKSTSHVLLDDMNEGFSRAAGDGRRGGGEPPDCG